MSLPVEIRPFLEQTVIGCQMKVTRKEKWVYLTVLAVGILAGGTLGSFLIPSSLLFKATIAAIGGCIPLIRIIYHRKQIADDAEKKLFSLNRFDQTKRFEGARILADRGYRKAEFSTGMAYLNGVGVNQNDHSAFTYLKSAADKGHTEAQYFVGAMYSEGKGRNQSDELALLYYTNAANNGNAQAKIQLAKRKT